MYRIRKWCTTRVGRTFEVAEYLWLKGDANKLYGEVDL